jgi:putative hydrolase of the HAD superfamily
LSVAAIRLITFDLDNTLWSVEDVLVRAEARMRAWLDANVPDYYRLLDRDAILELRSTSIAENPRLAHDVTELRKDVLYRGIRRCGYGEREARAHAEAAFSQFFEARQEVVLFDGALEALEALAAESRLAALTNGNADIRRIGLDRYFAFALAAADVGASKPAPDIFHAALRRVRVTPREGIHIGDHLVDDVAGARGVGMHTIWVNHAGLDREPHHAEPTSTIGSLRELERAVTSIARTEMPA